MNLFKQKKGITHFLFGLLVITLSISLLSGCAFSNQSEELNGSNEIETNIDPHSNENKLNDNNEIDLKLIPKRVNGLYGFVDSTNTWVIEPKYTEVKNFREGYAAVGTVSEKLLETIREEFSDNPEEMNNLTGYTDLWGFINIYGEEIVELKNKSVGNFSNGLAFVQDENTQYYIDMSGNTVITLDNGMRGCDFEEDGTAIVKQIDPEDNSITIKAVIDRKGDFIIPFSYGLTDIDEQSFGYRVASPKERENSNSDKGVINSSGEWVIEPLYSHIELLSDSRILVTNYESNNENFIIDYNGAVISDLPRGEIYNVAFGMITYNISEGQEAELTVFNSEGNRILGNGIYKNIIIFGKNSYFVKDGSGGYLVDANGRHLIDDSRFTLAYPLTETDLCIFVASDNGTESCGIFSLLDNEWIVEPIYYKVVAFNDGGVVVRVTNYPSVDTVGYVLETFNSNGEIIYATEEEIVELDSFKSMFLNVDKGIY